MHLKDGTLVLYDVTSSYLEGCCCALARFGYSRDGRRDKLQIVIGLICAADGRPVAVEVRGRRRPPGGASASAAWPWSVTAA
jgi:transposase